MFPNGSVISPDGNTLIVAETAGHRLTAFEIASDGTLHDRRVWAAVDGYAPDGCTIDEEGGIWFADARGDRVARVVEGGAVTDVLDTGAPTFACMLGGPDGRTLFALTAPGPSREDAEGRGAGAILATEVRFPHAGLP